ncbi:MAG: hypothetical protein KUG77_25760 [Nannocystaceae bacterium]|nr:hypothetical protein [Nannocystaceae bacterium]
MLRSMTIEGFRRHRFVLAICLLDSACAPHPPSDAADEPIASSSSSGSPHDASGMTSTSGGMPPGSGGEMPGSDGSGTSTSAHDVDLPSENSTGFETDGGDPIPALCPPTDGCFSWCGIEHSDGTCRPAQADVIDEGAPSRCADVHMFVTASGDVELGPQTDDEDLRCFLQFLRYSRLGGVARLHWENADGQAATLRVDGRAAQTVGLSMLVEGVDVACGETVALEASHAHVLARDHILFSDCLDTGHPVDARSCILGQATDFFAGHDFVYDVAFPWLTGSCSFGESDG